MANSVNRVFLLGRLGHDPEVRYTTAGTAVVTFTLATNEPYKDDDGWKERAEWHHVVAFGRLAEIGAEWHHVVAFGRLAEIVGNHLAKGAQVHVEGKLRTKKWEDAQGVTRMRTEIMAKELVMMSGRQYRGGDRQEPSAAPGQGGPAGYPEGQPTASPPDNDIPF